MTFTVVVTRETGPVPESEPAELQRTMTIGSVNGLRELFEEMLKHISPAEDKLDNPVFWRTDADSITTASKSGFFSSKSVFSNNSYKMAAVGANHQLELNTKRLHE